MIDKYKCRVTANRLVMEVLDEDGNPVIVTKKDTFGGSYQETAEVQYRKGDIIFLPESAIKIRSSSLEMVLEPVKVGPVKKANGTAEVSSQPEKSEKTPAKSMKDEEEVTVADLIPKEEVKDTPKEKAKATPGKDK